MIVKMYGIDVVFDKYEFKSYENYDDGTSKELMINAARALTHDEALDLIDNLKQRFNYINDIIEKHNAKNPIMCSCWRCRLWAGRGGSGTLHDRGRPVGFFVWYDTGNDGDFYRLEINSEKNMVSFLYSGSENGIKNGSEYAFIVKW